jgi:CRP-like cAMP-binding protein
MSDPKTIDCLEVASTEVEWQPIKIGKDKRDTDLRRTLNAVPLFANLPRRYWRELTSLFHFRAYEDQEIIFHYATPGLGMYIIIEGSVLILALKDETYVEIARLARGDFFGEMSLVEEVERGATAMSSGKTRLIGIFRPQLQNLIHRRPRLGLALMERLARILTTRLRESNRKLSDCRDQLNREEKK